MANKLRDMKLTSVDLCKRGANPKSHIRLFKSREDGEGGESEMKLAKSYCIGEAENMVTTLFKSLESIISDDSLDSIEKQELMTESLQDFTLDVTDSIEDWSESIGKAGDDPEDPEDDDDFEYDDDPEEPDDDDGDDWDDDDLDDEGLEEKKARVGKSFDEGVYDMGDTVIEIEKMSPEDQAILKSLQEKYTGNHDEPEIHPEVKKGLEELEELKKSYEMGQLTEIAKKYEIIGKKADELASKLYELKKSGGTNYDDYVAMLDEMVDMQNQSGVFKEFGSSRSGNGGSLEATVAELRKSMPDATREELVIKAYETNPNLDPFSGNLK